MSRAERDLKRLLENLRAVIGRIGFTHGEVDDALGWGSGRIEMLLDRREAIDVGEVVAILHVLGVEPGEFFAGVFPPGPPAA